MKSGSIGEIPPSTRGELRVLGGDRLPGQPGTSR